MKEMMLFVRQVYRAWRNRNRPIRTLYRYASVIRVDIEGQPERTVLFRGTEGIHDHLQWMLKQFPEGNIDFLLMAAEGIWMATNNDSLANQDIRL